jgi:hypothetical protein
MEILSRIPVVGGLAYIEHIRTLPPAFSARLSVEPGNRYFPYAIAVAAHGTKVGYVAPEIAPHYYETIKNASSPVSCPARRALPSDHETSGVELFLDFSTVPAGDAS